MLSREQANARLKEFAVVDGKGQRLKRVAELREPICTLGNTLLNWQLKYGHVNFAREADVAAAAGITQVEPADWKELMHAIFPKGLAEHVVRAPLLFQRLPYQIGWERKAFRAPNEYLATSRRYFDWLIDLLRVTNDYEEDIVWYAEHAAYLNDWGQALSYLLATVIDQGDATAQKVYDILVASAKGVHEIGTMGRHVTRTLLTSSQEEGWRFIESLLLAAQRNEGLRQDILESIDESHPDAFKAMLRVIRDQKLMRFSATVRAMDVWFGFNWSAVDRDHVKQLTATLDTVIEFLDNPEARRKALDSHTQPPQLHVTPHTLYLALWCEATIDSQQTVPLAAPWLVQSSAEHRFVAMHLLRQLGLTEAMELMPPLLDDLDLRIVAKAVRGLAHASTSIADDTVFERLETLLMRLKKDTVLEPLVWEWEKHELLHSNVADILRAWLRSRPISALFAHIPEMSPDGRLALVKHVLAKATSDGEVRAVLLQLAGDSSLTVRRAAFETLKAHVPTGEEAVLLERLFARKSSDLRRGVLQLLLNQDDEAIRESVARLGVSKSDALRKAGNELEHEFEKKLGVPQAKAPTLKDAFGLLDRAQLTPVRQPQFHNVTLFTEAAVQCIHALDRLIHEHRDATFKFTHPYANINEDVLLGDAFGRFPFPSSMVPIEQDVNRLPLKDVWQEWLTTRSNDSRDGDGFELYRALAFVQAGFEYDYTSVNKTKKRAVPWASSHLADEVSAQYARVLPALLQWLVRLSPAPGTADFLLDAAEHTLSVFDPDMAYRSRDNHVKAVWFTIAKSLSEDCVELDARHIAQLWHLTHWADMPQPYAPRQKPDLEIVLAATIVGAATEADVIEQLLTYYPQHDELQQSGAPNWILNFYKNNYYSYPYDDLSELSSRKGAALFEKYPALRGIYDRCVTCVLEVELARGEMPTEASKPAIALKSINGARNALQFLAALGRDGLVREVMYGWQNELTRASVFSHLLRVSRPDQTDTLDGFKTMTKDLGIKDDALINLALFAPQWARFVEHALAWPGLAEGAYWLFAHTKDRMWHVAQEIRDGWQAQSSEYTPLTASELLEGAVDVAWFRRVYQQLGAARWRKLYDAAKYCSSGIGHTRAKLFADAMLGQVKQNDVLARIKTKRHQDSVRALGLLPLEDDDALKRYEAMQEFARGSKKFGPQQQTSEKLAVSIAMANLARTAGYPDPVRLEWAMEARSIADLRDGPVAHTHENVTLSLSINDLGEPTLVATRGEAVLAKVPDKLKKHEPFVGLKEREKQLVKQVSRMRQSLEAAMIRGNEFTAKELHDMLGHPMLKPMLAQLLFVNSHRHIGFINKNATALSGANGRSVKLTSNSCLQIAHPHDLLQSDYWLYWQRVCVEEQRIQPFKQIFRELYVLTAAEEDEGTLSHRYAGHQVNPKQAVALLGQRGWVVSYEGDAMKTFHALGFTAHLDSSVGFMTPGEVEVATIEAVSFAQRGEWQRMRLVDIPPRIFSEVMRDIDLVVSVAHAGGVDPESTASSIEMREALLRETCRLLKLGNVEFKGKHAIVQGKLNRYSVHLGSATVHQQPGGYLCIVPVHSQHHGRVFLPFADSDPRTAEVVTKVITLAKDWEIKDPAILEQITRVG